MLGRILDAHAVVHDRPPAAAGWQDRSRLRPDVWQSQAIPVAAMAANQSWRGEFCITTVHGRRPILGRSRELGVVRWALARCCSGALKDRRA